jgi:hypothetical protein
MSAKDDLAGATKHPDIVDPHNVPALFVDWIVTGGSLENVVNVTLGTIDHSFAHSGDPARIMVTSRLRFSREFAARLYRSLGEILGLPPPPSSEQGPEEPRPPPRNLIN